MNLSYGKSFKNQTKQSGTERSKPGLVHPTHSSDSLKRLFFNISYHHNSATKISIHRPMNVRSAIQLCGSHNFLNAANFFDRNEGPGYDR